MDPIIPLLGVLLLARIGRSGPGLGRARALPDVGAEDLDREMVAKVQLLAAKVSPIPVVITSGKRSGLRQARAMIAKIERGEDLRELYTSAARDGRLDALFSLPRTPEAWAPVLEDWARRGRSISDHMHGRAADLRIWQWSPSQYDQVVATAKALGLRTNRESDHLHLELPG